jgi:hypothetical protein
MRAKRNNAVAKIRRERKGSKDLCSDCGDPVADHISYFVTPVLIDEDGRVEPIPDRSQMN